MADSAGFGGNAVQFDHQDRDGLDAFVAVAANLLGDKAPHRIELPASDYPQLIARAPISILAVTGTSFTLLPKVYEGDLGAYLEAGTAPLTTSCAFPKATDCVFRHSVIAAAATPWGAVLARVASILSTSPDLASPWRIASDVLQQRDVVEISLKRVRIALAQKTRSLELTAAGLMRTALQLEWEGETPPPPNWHAVRATLPAGAAAVQLVPRLQWLNVGGEYLVWGATVPALFEEGALSGRVLETSELRDLDQFLHLRDAASRLVAPRMIVGPAESRDRRLHKAIDEGHVWAANHTDAKREDARRQSEVVKSNRRQFELEIDRESTPGGARRLRVRVYVSLSMLKRYLGPAAVVFVVLVGLYLVLRLLF